MERRIGFKNFIRENYVPKITDTYEIGSGLQSNPESPKTGTISGFYVLEFGISGYCSAIQSGALEGSRILLQHTLQKRRVEGEDQEYDLKFSTNKQLRFWSRTRICKYRTVHQQIVETLVDIPSCFPVQ